MQFTKLISQSVFCLLLNLDKEGRGVAFFWNPDIFVALCRILANSFHSIQVVLSPDADPPVVRIMDYKYATFSFWSPHFHSMLVEMVVFAQVQCQCD